MNDTLMQHIISDVVIPLLPLLQVLVGALISLGIWKLKKNIKSDEIKDYLSILQNLVCNIVGELNQTTIQALKESQGGKLTDDQKEMYFNQVKDKVMLQLTMAQTKVLKEVYTDLDAYIDSLIESTINSMKAS